MIKFKKIYININLYNLTIFAYILIIQKTYEPEVKLNNVIIFNSKKFRSGNFAINNNGDMIIEYSYNETRLFYGLKQNGRFFFLDENDNETPTKEINITNSKGEYIKRYESKNSFIFLNNNNNKQYLLSLSSFDSVTELYDLDNIEDNSIRDTIGLLNYQIFSYEFSLLELPINNKKEYLLIYTKSTNEQNQGDILVLDIISFPDKNLYNCNIVQKISKDNYYNRVVSGFVMNSLIIIFYLDRLLSYTIIIYDFEFTEKNIIDNFWTISDEYYNKGNGFFFKCLHLKENIGVFIFYIGTNNYSPVLKIGRIDENNFSFNDLFIITELGTYEFNNNDILLNDITKINDNRFSFVTTSKDNNSLYILLFDIFNDDKNIRLRIYKPNLNNYKSILELSTILYNNYLVFSSSVINSDALDEQNYFSIFMIFGFANGTDKTIDISSFFMDNNEIIENNLISELTKNITIDNNIFGYEIAEEINLVTIPEQIIFYNQENKDKKLTNNETLNINYIFKQNKNLIKTHEYYNLSYQFIIQEPNYEKFNSYADEIMECASSVEYSEVDQNDFFISNKFFGRTNTLQFKLCHSYCETCSEIGIDINDQKCESCLPDYQYDYPEISFPNCVPEGHYKNSQNKIVSFSEGYPKFFINITSGKTIYFDDSLDCPDEYPFLMINNNECKDFCPYEDLLNQECSIEKSNDLIYEILKELISTYPADGESIVVEGEEEYVFQLTTSINELDSLDGVYINEYNLSMIDLAECEVLIREAYDDIDDDIPLIFLKFEKSTSTALEKNVQFELYHPVTKEIIDLSICEDVYVDIYIPITLSEETQDKYINLKENGYNLFNINDSFYNDICTPYESDSGTDILLSDRKNYFYNNNDTTCQSNCEYSEYSTDTQYLKCQCNVEDENIDVKEPEKFTGKTIFTSFYSVLKYSNYKVLKCFKLVFNSTGISKNYGSIITIILFLLYIPCFVFYIIKGIAPIKIDAIKTYFKQEKENNNNSNNNSKNNIKIYSFKNQNLNNNNNIKENSKDKLIKIKNKIKIKRKRTNTEIDIFNKNNKLNINETNIIKKSIKKNNFPPKRKELKKAKKKNKPQVILTTIFNKKLRNSLVKEKEKKPLGRLDNIINKSQKINSKISMLESKNRKLNYKYKDNQIVPIFEKNASNLDDFELNELNYFEAIELDKRPFHRIYWTLLKREHKILFTFFSWNDYNLSYIKFARFFFLICTDMAMNVFFFSDDSMHKLYLDYGKYDFVQQIPQIIYSTIVSQALEVFLCFLSLTDKYIYQIKELRTKKNSKESILKIIKIINIKLIGFFIFTFVLFLFYWYTITAFCAVYKNTQIPFIKDSLTSFGTSLITPFLIYLLPTALRIISLKDVNKKRLKFVYKLSDIIPFF